MLRSAALRVQLAAPGGRAVRARRGAPILTAAAGRPPGRAATRSRARHPRRRPAASGGAGRESPARADACRPVADRARVLLAAQQQATAEAIETLGQLSRGIYPPLLAEEGLAPRSAPPRQPVRCPSASWRTSVATDARIEAAAYFTCVEALQNAAKHASATVGAGVAARRPRVDSCSPSRTTGVGYATSSGPRGAGLANLRDRVESVGGTLTTASGPAGGPESRRCCPPGLESTGADDARPRLAWAAGRRDRRGGRRRHDTGQPGRAARCRRRRSRSTASRSSTGRSSGRRSWAP